MRPDRVVVLASGLDDDLASRRERNPSCRASIDDKAKQRAFRPRAAMARSSQRMLKPAAYTRHATLHEGADLVRQAMVIGQLRGRQRVGDPRMNT
jgi:hypothetical protein